MEDEEETLVRSRTPMYRLYFKGLVTEEATVISAGFGIAICGDKDDLLFDMNRPIHEPAITRLEAEIIALKCGLEEAVSMQIKDISICCDNEQIFELVMGRSMLEQENITMLIRDVQGIRQYLRSSIPVLLTRTQANFAYEFAIEAIIYMPVHVPVQEDMHVQKEFCSICMNDDINADHMFGNELCGHKFCSDCVRSHIEVKLAMSSSVTCPGYKCNSRLSYRLCVNILTPELKEKWEQKIKDDSIPVTNRGYCPNPRCSTLMSETELSGQFGFRQYCVKCNEPFCINCKVPWHSNLSCNQYNRLHPNQTVNDILLMELVNEKRWRQCRKCQHMIELSEGCSSLICRCGHKFCYDCGADTGSCYH
ncbi:hypothetical protein CARUB_v10025138mg, partial [Capsella rubella]